MSAGRPGSPGREHRFANSPIKDALDTTPVCLFAHHDASGRIGRHVLHYLTELAVAGFKVHVARSDARPISSADRAAITTAGATLHLRPNRGLDFGAWQHLIGQGCVAGASEILLANDSVIGPLAPLAPIRRAMAGFDAWGMVQSREGRTHLQSWFIVMTADAFARPAVRRVFAQDFGAMSKSEIIVHGELGLGAAFETEGLDCGARHVDAFGLRPSLLLPTNPTHFKWRSLPARGVPFIKIELLGRNPAGIIGIAGWERTLSRVSDYDVDVVCDPAMLLASASHPDAPAGRRRRRDKLGALLLRLALQDRRLDAIADAWRRRGRA